MIKVLVVAPHADDEVLGSGGALFPNVFLNVTATLDEKIDAMKKYGNQLEEKPHPRSEWGLRALAEFRGITVGVAAAEAFALIREIG